MKSYRTRRDHKLRETAFIAGFRSLQAFLARTFQGIGKGEMNGYTALEVVKNAKPHVTRET
jgi:hypothetical protein